MWTGILRSKISWFRHTQQIKSPQFGKALQALDTSEEETIFDTGIRIQDVNIYLWYVFIYTSLV